MKILRTVAATLALFEGSASAQESLSGADIQKALKDKRVSLSCIDGTQGSGRYTMQKNSGTITGSYARPPAPAVADAGQVRAQGDNLCLRFKLLNGGEERCFTVSEAGAGKFNFAVSGVNACTVAVR